MSGSHPTHGGGYRNDDVPRRVPSSRHPSVTGYRTSAANGGPSSSSAFPTAANADDGYGYGYGPAANGGYRPGDGGYPTSEGGYRPVEGGYRTSDGYRTSGGYRTSSGSHRTASGSRRAVSGSHRVVANEPRWGWRTALVVAGAVAGVAACAAVVVLVMGRAASSTSANGGHRATVQKESDSTNGEKTFSVVPDSCTLVSTDEAAKLVENFQQNPSTASDTDQHSQCVWTDFAQGSGRQVTVELRLINASGGKSAPASAHDVFAGEQAGDTSGGDQIDPAQTQAAHQPLTGLGSEAYLVYSVDSSQGFGQASVNVRTSNLLVSVTYGGSANNAPLDQQKATDGAKEAAQHVMQALGNQ